MTGFPPFTEWFPSLPDSYESLLCDAKRKLRLPLHSILEVMDS